MQEEYLATVGSKNSIAEVIRGLGDDDIESFAQEHIFIRGLDYYMAETVFDIVYEDFSITASVSGSYNYRVKLVMDDVELTGRCSCPYDDVCKHLIATLLKVKNSDKAPVKTSEEDDKKFIDYLTKLKHKELINLVDKFSPVNFRREIVMRDASSKERSSSLEKLKVEIMNTLEDESLLRDPVTFTDVALSYLDELMIYIDKSTEEAFKIVIYLSQQIEFKNDEGYLYGESCHYDYYEEEYFDFEAFSDKVLTLINAITNPSLQSKSLFEFVNFVKYSSYCSISYDTLKIKDKKLLRDFVYEIKTLDFFNYIKEVLSFKEQEMFLKQFEPNQIFKTLVELYIKHDKKTEAIGFAESLLKKSFDVEYANFLLQNIEISSKRLYSFVEQTIIGDGFRNYDFIVKHIKNCDATEELEKLFKKKRPHQYYDYLEKYKQIEEMYELLKIIPDKKLVFFQKYKGHYKTEAIDFFKEAINEQLNYTGKEHYSQIASHLKHLKELIDKDEFSTILFKLKLEYKRRRNFITILNESFDSKI